MTTQSRHYDGSGAYGGAITGPGQRTNVHAVKKLLKRAGPKSIFHKFCVKTPVPLKKTDTVAWRRAVNGAISTDTLTEGVTPDSQSIVYEDVTKELEERGVIYEITSRQRDLGEDNAVMHSSEVLADQIVNVRERVAWNESQNATNIIYDDPTTHSAITQVNSVVSGGVLQMASRSLLANIGDFYTEIDHGGTNEGTVTLEPAFIAIGHTDLRSDLRNLPGFVTTDKYGGRKTICNEEFGSYEDIRFLLSPYHIPVSGGGESSTTANVKTTNGDADVYPIIVMAKEAFGMVSLKGMEGNKGYGAVKIKVIDGETKDDPLNQRTYVAARWWDAYKILNQDWIQQVLVAATDDLTAS